MYAVIKTGGKQYRVQPGDVLVVEKLDGDVGAEIAFDQVLMLGDDGATHLGAPLLDGAVVRATLIETRKGDKVTTIKKIRRQGYRRTKGHRQIESVLRVTGLEGAGLSGQWDGEVSMMTRADMRLRARGLAPKIEQIEAESMVEAKKPAARKAVPKVEPEALMDAGIVDEQIAAETPVTVEAPATPEAEAKPVKKAAAPKKAAAEEAVDAGVVDEQAAAAEATPAKKKAAPKAKASPDVSDSETASDE